MEHDNNLLLEVKAAIAGACGVFTAAFGWMGWLVVGWVICMLADFATGCIAAGKNKEWKSEIARDGLWHKLGMIVAVCVAAGADGLLGLIVNNLPGLALPLTYTVLICPVVLVWYIVTEMGSIIENVNKLGTIVPPFLKKILDKLHKATESAGEAITKDKDTADK